MSNKASSTKNGMMIGNEAALPTSKANANVVIEPVIVKAKRAIPSALPALV